MAKVTTTFCKVGNRSVEGGAMPVPRLAESLSEVMESGAVSKAGQLTSTAPQGFGFVSVTAEGGAVWIVAGANPIASAPGTLSATGFLVLDGQTRDFAMDHGDRVAVIDR